MVGNEGGEVRQRPFRGVRVTAHQPHQLHGKLAEKVVVNDLWAVAGSRAVQSLAARRAGQR